MGFYKTLTPFLVLLTANTAFAGTHSYVERGKWDLNQVANIQSYDGEYDLNHQLEEIRKLHAEGKELKLIVGYGNKERGGYFFPRNPNVVYVFANKDGSKLTPSQGPHLWMDLENPKHLDLIDPGIFSEVIVNDPAYYAKSRLYSNQFQRILSEKKTIRSISYYTPQTDSCGLNDEPILPQASAMEESVVSINRQFHPQPDGHLQIQTQTLSTETKASLLDDQTYQELFFDPWTQLMREGRNREAAVVAGEVEVQGYEKMNKSLSRIQRSSMHRFGRVNRSSRSTMRNVLRMSIFESFTTL